MKLWKIMPWIFSPFIVNGSVQNLFYDFFHNNFRNNFVKNFNEDFNKHEVISEYISSQIKNYELSIANLKSELPDEDEEQYWIDITTKIEMNIIEKLWKNNTFLAEENGNIVIFNPELFYISKNCSKDDWDQENHTFSITAKYFNHEITSHFRLKTENFDSSDILDYFKCEIAFDQFLNFNVDDFEDNSSYIFKQQILKKLQNYSNTIFINDQEIAIDYELLTIPWINIVNIKNNLIYFGLTYDNNSANIKIATRYFLDNLEMTASLIKECINTFLEQNPNTFDAFHPFDSEKIVIDQRLYTYLEKNLQYRDLKLTFYKDDISFKLKSGNKFVNPVQVSSYVNFFYKNVFVETLTYNFSNYFRKFVIQDLQNIISDQCTLDLSKINLEQINDDIYKNEIIHQVYQQIKQSKIKIGSNIYDIESIYNEKNFELELTLLPHSEMKNPHFYMFIKVVYEDSYEQSLEVGVKYEQINNENLIKKWNQVFQDSYVANEDEQNKIGCQAISACFDIESESETSDVSDLDYVFEKWKNIIGKRKVFLENFQSIDADYFEVESATLRHLDIENEDETYILNESGAKIKQSLHNDKQKFNSVVLILKIKEEFLTLDSDWAEFEFVFIFPLQMEESE